MCTVIVEGPLAAAMRRFAAAQAGEIGLQILSFSRLAARSAGGFTQPLTSEILEPAIQEALKEKGFKKIGGICELPGMTPAVARALRKAWAADIDLVERAEGGAPRLSDLAEIEQRVRAKLPRAVLLPRDLCARIAKFAELRCQLGLQHCCCQSNREKMRGMVGAFHVTQCCTMLRARPCIGWLGSGRQDRLPSPGPSPVRWDRRPRRWDKNAVSG